MAKHQFKKIFLGMFNQIPGRLLFLDHSSDMHCVLWGLHGPQTEKQKAYKEKEHSHHFFNIHWVMHF